MTKQAIVENSAEAYLELLSARGGEYLFANAGTDFATILEAYAKRQAQGQALPRPVTVSHEITATIGPMLLTGHWPHVGEGRTPGEPLRIRGRSRPGKRIAEVAPVVKRGPRVPSPP